MLSCSHHSVHWEALRQVETSIEAQPDSDSALAALQRIDAQELTGKEERAKYALLLSMALDKNYVTRQTSGCCSLPQIITKVTARLRTSCAPITIRDESFRTSKSMMGLPCSVL